MLAVRKNDGSLETFNKFKIIESIRKETGCEGKIIEQVVDEVEHILQSSPLQIITGPLIREVVNSKFLEHELFDCRKKYTRVGMPVYDARRIDTGSGKGDNANLQDSPETGHKRKADQLSKEQYLLMFPDYITEAHLNGDIHIHDLEYFGSRQFCLDSDLRYFFYYGFVGDGTGDHTSFAAPAKRPEVAVLHAVKVLGSSQTNCAGGQGFYNFLTFLAPYFKGCSYDTYKQCMQMFVYEMTQMLVARGGQSLQFDEILVVKDQTGTISLVKIGEFCHRYQSNEGAYVFNEYEKIYETLSLNRETGGLEWKPINGVYVHKPHSQLKETRLSDGRSVVTTSDHSLFTLDGACNIVEVSPNERPTTILVAKSIPHVGKDIDHDLMFLIGACIGDGNLYANNGVEDSAININVSSKRVCERIQQTVQRYGISKCEFVPMNEREKLFHSQFQTEGIPYITEIGHGAPNKQIPNQLLSASDASLYALLDGLVSTDGNIARRRYEYNTTSVTLAYQLEFILRRLGLDYSTNCSMKSSNFNRNYPVYVIRISASNSTKLNITNENRQFKSWNGPDQQKHDYRAIKQLVKDRLGIGFYKYGHSELLSNARKLKYQHLEDLQDVIPDIWNKVRASIPMEVKSITSYCDTEKYVYDIGVDDNENFVLHNGIVCHNTVFSSVQLSPGIPDLWRDIPVVYKGKKWDGSEAPLKTYGEFEKENRLLFKALMEVMIEGDAVGKPFYFPKPEISIEPQFIQTMEWEDDHEIPEDIPSIRELYLLSFKLASKFGTPYFDNQIPQYRGAGKGISCFQCCAYCFSSNEESDDSFIDKLHFKDGAHFSMGSYQVMTVNFPRLAYEAVDATDDERARETYFEGLAKMRINLCCEVFKLKREMLKDVKAPFLQQSHNGSPHLVDFDSLVYTVGVIGINEVCEILYGKQLHESQETQVKAMLFVMKMKQYCAEKSKEHGFTIAFARTPAETTAQRFAVLDLLNYGNAHKFVKGDVKGAIRKYAETGSRDLPIYYTNGTHVPVDAGIPLAEKIRIEQAFFPILDGGNICNIYLGEQKPDPRGLMDMTLKICESTNLGYFAFTRDFTVCNNGYRQY